MFRILHPCLSATLWAAVVAGAFSPSSVSCRLSTRNSFRISFRSLSLIPPIRPRPGRCSSFLIRRTCSAMSLRRAVPSRSRRNFWNSCSVGSGPLSQGYINRQTLVCGSFRSVSARNPCFRFFPFMSFPCAFQHPVSTYRGIFPPGLKSTVDCIPPSLNG